MSKRIYLSVPHMGPNEEGYVHEAFATNWMTTVGANLDAFEKAFSERIGQPCVALASGTAAIHLGLRLLGVGPGDEVMVSDLTFVASVNPIRYLGAEPVFVDSDRTSWNMDPALLAEALDDRARRGRLPRAVMVVDLYGQSADMDPILAACRRHGVPVLEDAAEAVGTLYKGRPAGTLGDVNVFSFNGNKIITTTSGGMLSSPEPGLGGEGPLLVAAGARSARRVPPHRDGLQLPDVERARRHRPRAARGPRRAGARSGAPSSSGTGRPSPTCPASSPCRRRPSACTPAGSPASSSTRSASARPATSSSRRSPPGTSRGARCGSPCTCSRSTRGASGTAGEVGADLYRRGLCLPSSSSLTCDEQDVVVDLVRKAARG